MSENGAWGGNPVGPWEKPLYMEGLGSKPQKLTTLFVKIIPFCGWALFNRPAANGFPRLRSHSWNKKRSKRGKGFSHSIPSVGPGADPGVQAVSLQVTVSHPPGGRLPLLSASPAVTSPAAEHHRPLAGTKLYCFVTEAHRCKQLA